MKTTTSQGYQPKTGQPCSCRPGQQRDNCPQCEGTGMWIDFKAIREHTQTPAFPAPHPLANGISAMHLPNAKTKFSVSHRKEKNGFYAEYSALVPTEHQEMHAVVNLRLYWPGTVCYACVWISSYRSGSSREYISAHGSGQAGGGGYCKASAAAQAAIDNAGFRLSEPIDGRGTNKIKDAVLAIAHALGFENARVHVAHA